MTQRYLLTGAQGFVGRHMVSHLLRHSPQATVLGVGRSLQQDSCFTHLLSCGDRRIQAPLPEYLLHAVGARYSYISTNLTSVDFAAAVRDFRPTKVIHLAGSLRGDTDEAVYQNNVQSTASLLEAMSENDVEMFVFASSGGVYGKQDHFPIEETAAVQPLDSYSRSKLACEDLVREFARQSGVPTAIARIFNVVGPGQDDLHFAGRIAGQIASIVADKAERTVRVGPLSSSRDFLDVRDVCHGLVIIFESNHQGVYNVGSQVETNVDELLQIFLDSAGLRNDIQIDFDAARIDPVPRHVANMKRLAAHGFVPKYSLELSCQEMLAYCGRYVCSSG